MLPCHLFRLSAYATLLFLVHQVSAQPAHPFPDFPTAFRTSSNCPLRLDVGEGLRRARITLKDSLVVSLKPNLPAMSMEIVEGDVMYKATVDGTMIQLLQCGLKGKNCEIVSEGGSKSINLLVPNKWNTIYVNYNKGKINVDINMKASVMGNHMATKLRTKSSSVGAVTFVMPPAYSTYNASLEIPCSEEDELPEVHMERPILHLRDQMQTTTSHPHAHFPKSPYKDCPIYQVEMDHPSAPAILFDNLTLAVYPSHPLLHLTINDEARTFKIQMYGQNVKLLECGVKGGRCVFKDEVKHSVEAEKWNFVTIFLLNNKLLINIRVEDGEEKTLLTDLPSISRGSLTVTAYAPEQLRTRSDRNYYMAFVNVKCEVIEQEPIFSSFTGIPKGLPTNAPFVETTTETATAPGFSRDVGIIVAVLVIALVIIVLAIIISTVMKKRRSAAISEQSPLQNQFQQQN